jgi:ribulose-phosphate 3-epimerase
MGPDMCRALRDALPGVFLDVHLMVTDPGKFVEPFVRAGAANITFHVEVMDSVEATALAERIRSMGATAGIAINPPTPIETVLPLVDRFDLVLVMSVNPGFSGQKFIQPSLEKTRLIRPRLRPSQRLQMDGGIGTDNSVAVREAGCDVLVAASAVFGAPPSQREEVIATLRGSAASY